MSRLVLEKLKEHFPSTIEVEEEFRGDLSVRVKKDQIVGVSEYLRNDPELRYDLIVDVCGVDMYRPEARFEVVYHLYSLQNKEYLRLKVEVDESDPVVDTVSHIWPGANWHERETFDMYGITFRGHPDLRRMYMPEDYEYYPLRKDFPLLGVPDAIPLPRR